MYRSTGFNNHHSQFCFKYTLYFFGGVFGNLILRKLVTSDVSRLYKNMGKHVWIANVEKQGLVKLEKEPTRKIIFEGRVH